MLDIIKILRNCCNGKYKDHTIFYSNSHYTPDLIIYNNEINFYDKESEEYKNISLSDLMELVKENAEYHN